MSDSKAVERDFYSIRELAQKIGKCYRTVHRAVQAGKIRATRFGASVMISRREVERVLEKGF